MPVMGPVGEALGLQAEAPAISVGRAALAGDAALQVIPGVELNAGLGGQNLQLNAGGLAPGQGGGAG